MNDGTPAIIRPATACDLPRVVAAADRVFRTPLRPGLGSMGRDYPLLFDPDNADNLWLAEAPDGTLLAHAGFVVRPASALGRPLTVACFGAVFTVTGQQGRGLATAVFTAATAHARAAGADLALVSGARGLYERAGFFQYPPCRRYRLVGTPTTRLTGAQTTRAIPASATALPDLMALQAAEPVRFERTPEDWTRLLAAGIVFFSPAEVFLMERSSRTVGYAVVARLAPSDTGLPTARILEVAGDRRAIAEAAPQMARFLAVPALELVLPPFDQALEADAHDLGWEPGELRFPFSAAWWNPACADLPLPFYGLNYV